MRSLFIYNEVYQLTMDTTNKSSDRTLIRTYLVVGLGVIGSVLLVLGIIFSLSGFSAGIGLTVFGLVILVVAIIVFVVITDGIDTSGPTIYYGPEIKD